MSATLNVKELLEDFVSLIFPTVCVNCQEVLMKNEEILCTSCLLDLPYTNDHKTDRQTLYQRLVSIPNLSFAYALLQFNQQGISQKLLHALKYKGRQDIGIFLGVKCGNVYKNQLENFDFIIPVPIHTSKVKQRGYNQSNLIAQGLSEVTGIPVLESTVVRKVKTTSQTKKTKLQRWSNIESIYQITDVQAIRNKKLLLVDDVITTGATITILAEALVSHQVLEVGIIAIASGK